MKSYPNCPFFSPYRLKIWRMTLKFCPVWPWNLSNHQTLKNNRVPLLWYFKLCASFQNYWWIQTGVIVQKRSIRVKIDDVYVLCDLEISRMTLNRARSSFVHNFIAICEVRIEVSVQKRPNLVKSSFELFDLAFWPLTLTFCMDITFVMIFKFDGWPQKIIGHLFYAMSSFACASFHSHQWIQTGVTVQKRPIRVKIGDFLSRVTLKFDGWPWKTIEHLSSATSSFVHHFIAICVFKQELWSGNG